MAWNRAGWDVTPREGPLVLLFFLGRAKVLSISQESDRSKRAPSLLDMIGKPNITYTQGKFPLHKSDFNF